MRYAALLGTLAVGLIAYSAYWFKLADQIDDEVTRWTEARREDGLAISYDSLVVTGFPYRIQPEIRNLRVRGPVGDGMWEWRTEAVLANLLPYNLEHIVIRIPEPVDLTVQRPDKPPARYRLTPEEALASVVVAPEPAARLAVDIKGGMVTGDGINGSVSLDRVQIHARQGNPDTISPPLLEISFQVEGVEYPGFSGSALGDAISRVTVNAGITGKWPPDGGEITPAMWRDGGGAVQITDLEVGWGPLDLTAAGTLALDKQDRPTGSLTARVKGYDGLVNALHNAGQLNENEARAAKTALGIVALATGGTGGTLSLPLILQDGYAFLGPVRIAALPRLSFPNQSQSVRP